MGMQHNSTDGLLQGHIHSDIIQTERPMGRFQTMDTSANIYNYININYKQKSASTNIRLPPPHHIYL